jgi:hypothetical protein
LSIPHIDDAVLKVDFFVHLLIDYFLHRADSSLESMVLPLKTLLHAYILLLLLVELADSFA